MNSLKTYYAQNSILQFIVSYFLVLIMPIILCVVGFQIAFQVVAEDIRTSNLTMLNHSKNLIDVQVSSIEDMSLQVSKDSSVLTLIRLGEGRSPAFYLYAPETIDKFGRILSYQGTSILGETMLYLQDTNYVIANMALYDVDFYRQYVKSLKNEVIPFKDELKSLNIETPVWRVLGGDFCYIYPVRPDMMAGQAANAMVISSLDTKKLLEIFDDSLLRDGAYLQIIGRDGSQLFAHSQNGVSFSDYDAGDREGILEEQGRITLYTTSSQTGWKYILTVPKATAMVRLNHLKISVLFLLIIACLIGSVLAFYLSVRKGRPLNALFFALRNSSSPEANGAVAKQDLNRLSGVVSHIISNNKLLLEQMEQEKPLLQTIFLQKLIRGEFVNEQELTIQAKKVGIVMNATQYLAASFRVFPNNDFYNTDLNTIQEVSVISRLIQNEILQASGCPIWFYETDYLTTMVLFGLEDGTDRQMRILEQVNRKIARDYRLTPFWGLGNVAEHLSQIWQSCEEAKSALEYGIQHENASMTQYSAIRSGKNYYYPKLFEHRLANCVRSGDTQGIMSLLELLEKENFQNRSLDSVMFQRLHNEIAEMLIQLGGSEDIPELHAMEELSRSYLPKTVSSYFTILLKILFQISHSLQQEKSASQFKMIERILEYIHASYTDSSLGLSAIAAKFNISEGYVSTLFKEKVHVNFAEYVEKMRVDAACELLKEPGITVAAIAERVGYNSVQSFRRAFKKVKNVSPKEMRGNE